MTEAEVLLTEAEVIYPRTSVRGCTAAEVYPPRVHLSGMPPGTRLATTLPSVQQEEALPPGRASSSLTRLTTRQSRLVLRLTRL